MDQAGSESGLNGEGWSDLGDGSQSHVRSETEAESDAGGPCVRVLEGHTKGVSAIYFEDTCLVRPSSILTALGLTTEAGLWRLRQNPTTMGRFHGPMRADDGHPLGY